MPIEFRIFKLVTKSVGGSCCGTRLKILAYPVSRTSAFLFDVGTIEALFVAVAIEIHLPNKCIV
jgi:hypothetical protein